MLGVPLSGAEEGMANVVCYIYQTQKDMCMRVSGVSFSYIFIAYPPRHAYMCFRMRVSVAYFILFQVSLFILIY